MTDTINHIKQLRKLIWENYFRQEGDEPEIWKNNHCVRLSEILKQRKAEGAPTKKTLYNFSRNNSASQHTLSCLVECVFYDNVDFLDFWKEKYFGNFNDLWPAFQDYANFPFSSKNPEKPPPEPDEFEIAPGHFPDPLLTISRILKNNPYFIFFFFFFLYEIMVVSLAIVTGLWNGIGYPLKSSYTVWIGYVFFTGAATTFVFFNQKLSQLLSFVGYNGLEIIGRLTSKKMKTILLVLALLISSILHYSFLMDNIHGWCESEPGSLSILGSYHLLLYAFNLWIVFLFIFYFLQIDKIIKSIGENTIDQINYHAGGQESIIKVISSLNIYYKILVLCFGGFSVLFIFTSAQFVKQNALTQPYFWQWIEIVILVILYVVFGFVLYWRYFVKHISNYLISERNKKLLHYSRNKMEVVDAISFPTMPDEIDRHHSAYLNILIWVMTLVILLFSGSVLL